MIPLENSAGGSPLKFDECTHDLFPPIVVIHSACIMYDTKNTWPNSLSGGSFTHLWFYMSVTGESIDLLNGIEFPSIDTCHLVTQNYIYQHHW